MVVGGSLGVVSWPRLFIARGKRVLWNVYSVLVPGGKILMRPIRLQNGAYITVTFEKKDCDTNLKGPRKDWLPSVQQVIDVPIYRLSSTKYT